MAHHLKLSFFLASAFFFSTLIPFSVRAAPTDSNGEVPAFVPTGSTAAPTEQQPSCFDYYQFGSVPVSISAELASAQAGTPFAIRTTITNKNDYPLIDTAVYVRVTKLQALGQNNINGPDTVDFLPVAEHLTLKTHETRTITYTWTIPADEEPGQYQMVSFVTQSNRFNLLGLTFTDDITGGQYNFSIVNSIVGGVRFDKTTGMLNGVPFRFAAFSPIVAKETTDVPVSIAVMNTTKAPYVGVITWKLYQWDGQRPEKLIAEESNPVTIAAHASTTVSFIAKDRAHTVYYLSAELKTKGGSQSMVGFRFVRPSVIEPRIADLAVNKYPYGPGSTAFLCFHSAGPDKADNVSVNLSVRTLPLFGFLSFPISSRSYSGVAHGNILALTLPGTHLLHSFELVGTISQNGKQIDQVVVPYDCKVLEGCTDYMALEISVGALLLIAALCGGLLWIQKRKKRL